MCTKVVQHTARNIGKTYKSVCEKPDYKDGLCKHHYSRKMEKQKNWIDRDDYRPATQNDLDTGRSLKLRNTNQHNLYQLRKGVIKQFSSTQNKYIEVDIAPDFNLFCVLDY